MQRSYIACAVAVLATGGVALGGPTFLGTQGTTLYRTDGVNVETFTLSAPITSMAVGPDGTIWASPNDDMNTNGFRELYTLSDPLGPAPSLVLHSDFLVENTPTMSFVGNTLYGIQRASGSPPETTTLVTIDLLGMTQSVVGLDGLMGTGGNGSAYDPVNDKFYAIRGATAAELLDIDYGLTMGPNPTATLVGNLGISYVNGGAEFFNGTMYAMVQSVGGPSERFLLGTVDTSDGTFSTILDMDARMVAPVGMVVIPEPATLSLLGVLGLALVRRRR